MKTQEELQLAVDEIKLVCQKYGVKLIGTCHSEAIYGEITIDACSWSDPQDRLTNRVEPAPFGSDFVVTGIG